MQFDPERLVQLLRNRQLESNPGILVFWYCVTSGRQDYMEKVKSCSTDPCLVPIILQDDSFTNANALLSDLNRLLCEHESKFKDLPIVEGSDDNKVTILLLSKSEFGHPQTASPTILPEWFPVWGGKSQYVYIEDLARVADSHIDAKESHIESIGNTLYYLENAMLEQIVRVSKSDKNEVIPLFEIVKDLGRNKVSTFDEWLQTIDSYRKTLQPVSYRPSAGNKGSLIGCIILIQQFLTLEQIPGCGEKLLRALGINAKTLDKFDRPQDSLFAVLLRPTGGDMHSMRRTGRNLISTVFAASQFVTASHHAGEYDTYSVVLLRHMSFDIRTTIARYTELLHKIS